MKTHGAALEEAANGNAGDEEEEEKYTDSCLATLVRPFDCSSAVGSVF